MVLYFLQYGYRLPVWTSTRVAVGTVQYVVRGRVPWSVVSLPVRHGSYDTRFPVSFFILVLFLNKSSVPRRRLVAGACVLWAHTGIQNSQLQPCLLDPSHLLDFPSGRFACAPTKMASLDVKNYTAVSCFVISILPNIAEPQVRRVFVWKR